MGEPQPIGFLSHPFKIAFSSLVRLSNFDCQEWLAESDSKLLAAISKLLADSFTF
jgi:hypothetical protein